MSIYGSYEDMRDWMRREAGDDSPQSHVFIPGVDFDPSDPDDVQSVLDVGERDIQEKEEYWRKRAANAEAQLEAMRDELEDMAERINDITDRLMEQETRDAPA